MRPPAPTATYLPAPSATARRFRSVLGHMAAQSVPVAEENRLPSSPKARKRPPTNTTRSRLLAIATELVVQASPSSDLKSRVRSASLPIPDVPTATNAPLPPAMPVNIRAASEIPDVHVSPLLDTKLWPRLAARN